MSIRPPSDIILDVARAADPVRSQMAMAKLARFSAATPADGDVFADLLGEASATGAATGLGDPEADLTDLRTRLAMTGGPGSRIAAGAKAGRALEAFVLKGFIQAMMPKSERIFGKGNAGEIWRSMMSEQIAKQVAEAGGVGIARALTPQTPQAGTSSVLPIRPLATAGLAPAANIAGKGTGL